MEKKSYHLFDPSPPHGLNVRFCKHFHCKVELSTFMALPYVVKLTGATSKHKAVQHLFSLHNNCYLILDLEIRLTFNIA